MSALNVLAQETNTSRQIYNQAESEYDIQFMDADIFAWASIYSSDGQIRSSKDGKVADVICLIQILKSL